MREQHVVEVVEDLKNELGDDFEKDAQPLMDVADRLLEENELDPYEEEEIQHEVMDILYQAVRGDLDSKSATKKLNVAMKVENAVRVKSQE